MLASVFHRVLYPLYTLHLLLITLIQSRSPLDNVPLKLAVNPPILLGRIARHLHQHALAILVQSTS
jgi:hypothetical protein